MTKRLALLSILFLLAASIISMVNVAPLAAQDAPTATPLPALGPTAVPPTPEPPPHCPAFEGEAQDIRTSYYMGEGIAYANSNQTNNAIFSFTCVIRVVDPNYLAAYMYRGAAYARQRDYERAIRDYTSAIELNGSLVEAYVNRGVLYTTIREYDEAAADFDRVIQLDPDNLNAYNNRAVLHALNGDYDTAITTLQRAIDLSGIDAILAAYRDPDREPDAEPTEFDPAASRAYALIGVMYSAKSLIEYDNYMFLNRVNGYGTDERVVSAASALESRFSFEMRLDDGTWMTTANFSPIGD